jgi:hypothetical protein
MALKGFDASMLEREQAAVDRGSCLESYAIQPKVFGQ